MLNLSVSGLRFYEDITRALLTPQIKSGANDRKGIEFGVSLLVNDTPLYREVSNWIGDTSAVSVVYIYGARDVRDGYSKGLAAFSKLLAHIETRKVD
jgi:hypothetical protein